MRISAAVAVWMCAAFALICLGFAYTAFSGLATLTDAAERDASLGYGWFWTFLFCIAAVFGGPSWLMKTRKLGTTHRGSHGSEAGGERGIRTLETLLTFTRFPSVRLKPLGHLSARPKF